MRAVILGSAAGGGFPQWNCGCPNCAGLRAGDSSFVARTQDSLAVSSDSGRWFLFNASPEIGQQIESFSPLHPRAPRHSPISAIVLTNGDLDHCLGLFSLRESHPLVLYATARVREGIVRNVLYRTLERFRDQVVWRPLLLGVETPLCDREGEPSGLSLEARPLPGKLPVHLEGLGQASPEDNIGLWVRDGDGRLLVYAPGVGTTEGLPESVEEAQVLIVDGTFYRSDELVRLGLSDRRAEQMAHVPIDGPEGTLARLAHLRARKIYTHINNSNPILRAGSPERQVVEAGGFEVGYDGLEVMLG